MRHILRKRITAIVLVVCFLSATTSYAETTQDDIENAKNQITDLQNQKDNAENAVDSIEGQKDKLETELSGLNRQLSDLVGAINELENQIAEQEDKIEQAKEELAAAEEQAAGQYEDMKLRIQFMYENGNVSAWDTLLQSSSFTDFLNRTEYIRELNEYDRRKLVEFEELKAQIAEQKEQLEERMQELVTMQENMETKKKSVNGLVNSTKAEIAKSEQELLDAKSNVDQLDDKIKQMIAYEQELEIQKAKEDAARMEAIKAEEQEDTSGVVYVPEDSDAYLLGAIIQCEAEGESYEGKLAVGSVVLNRVKSSYFPNSISGVIYQSGQFSPVASGRLAYRLETGVNSTCLQAAQEVLNGNITLSSLYFRTNNGYVQGTVIGNHVFY